LVRDILPLITAGMISLGLRQMAVGRRQFIFALGGAAVAWPLAARAQDPGRTYRIGFLTPVLRESYGVFFDELRLYGFIEGQNLLVIPGGFGVSNDQIASVAASLVAALPDVIAAGPSLQLHALRQLTRTIPIIGMTEDMVADGLVASLARPDGNITGLSLLSPELDGKRQDILIEAVPGLRKIALLADSNVAEPAHLQVLQEAAHGRGIEALVRGVAKRGDVISAIDEVKASGAQAINFLATPMFSINNADFIRHVTALRLPSIYQWPEDAEDGALAAYGPRFTETYRVRARIVAKVLRGAKPSDIPVEQPTRFELVINLKTAKAIGHEVPAGLVARADKLIE
jgi:putative tryptophan/tyrosine transport system substrate-binding protein